MCVKIKYYINAICLYIKTSLLMQPFAVSPKGDLNRGVLLYYIPVNVLILL